MHALLPAVLHNRAVYNQLANFTAAEISSTLAALAALRYRWALSITLVSLSERS